jgi:hypothetical protein
LGIFGKITKIVQLVGNLHCFKRFYIEYTIVYSTYKYKRLEKKKRSFLFLCGLNFLIGWCGIWLQITSASLIIRFFFVFEIHDYNILKLRSIREQLMQDFLGSELYIIASWKNAFM